MAANKSACAGAEQERTVCRLEQVVIYPLAGAWLIVTGRLWLAGLLMVFWGGSTGVFFLWYLSSLGGSFTKMDAVRLLTAGILYTFGAICSCAVLRRPHRDKKWRPY